MSEPPPRIRRAVEGDVPAIVRLLADDALGAQRERCDDPLPAAYRDAFDAIERDPSCELVVAEDADGVVVATLQLTFTPGLAHQGAWRATIESVRVDRRLRGGGIGRRLIGWALERARQRGCRMVQLTTDKRRTDARRFYESLGFVASHEGMKLTLAPAAAPAQDTPGEQR